jgi:hypothetical protein
MYSPPLTQWSESKNFIHFFIFKVIHIAFAMVINMIYAQTDIKKWLSYQKHNQKVLKSAKGGALKMFANSWKHFKLLYFGCQKEFPCSNVPNYYPELILFWIRLLKIDHCDRSATVTMQL